MKLLLAIVLNALALIITALIVPGFAVAGFGTALIAAIVLGLVNTFIRPLLLFLTAPINFLTLGLFTFVVNAVVLEIVSAIVPGIQITSFGWALLAALVLAIVSTVLAMLLHDIEGVGGNPKKSKKR